MIDAADVREIENWHIDELDNRFKRRATWLSGARQCLNLAATIRDQKKLPLVVTMTFHLRSKESEAIGINFRSFSELEREQCDTPPELTVIHSGRRDWLDWIEACEPIKFLDFGVPRVQCFYSEWLNEQEYARHLWLTVAPS